MKWYNTLYICSGLALLGITTVAAKPAINETETYYHIRGESSASLRQQMKKHGPSSRKKEYFDASTVWYVQWNYSYQKINQLCRITQLDIQVHIHYHYPKWINYHESDPSLQNKWDVTLKQLHLHERMHGYHGKLAGEKIENSLQTLPPMRDCHSLQLAINETANRIIDDYNSKDEHYDAITQHGVKF